MAPINYSRLVKLHEQQPLPVAKRLLREAFEAKEIQPRDFDFGRLFVECFGWNAFRACKHEGAMATEIFQEAEGAVSTAAFQNISGQIIYNALLEGYTKEEFVFSKLIPEVQTPFNGEKIAGVSEIGDQALVVPEQEPYPLAGVREDWIQTPETQKRGLIVPLTREAIFFDRTGQVIDRANKVGFWLGYNKEVRAIDCVVDENETRHRYNWRGTTYASYQASSPWINVKTSNGLVDWGNVNAAEQILNQIVDPNTGTPVMLDPKHLVVTKQNEQVARRIVSATEIRVATPGFATTGNPTQTTMANPYLNKYTVITSRLLAQRMATDTDWLLADITVYAKYMYNFPLQIKEAPPNSHDEFHRDIVQQFRADERGAYVVVDPRTSCKSSA